MTETFFGTNILVYWVFGDARKSGISENLLRAGGFINVQILNEFAAVAIRKYRWRADQIRTTAAAVLATCAVAPMTIETYERTLTYVERHRLHLYDASLVAAAVASGCQTLYTEDMHHGLVIDGLTIKNPYR